MSNDNHDSPQSQEDSTNRLVKILIAVGIGVPVLIELMTLFNLINVQIFGGGDEEINQKEEPVSEVQRFAEGDTLFKDYTSPVLIDEMRAKVSVQQWRFALRLVTLDTWDTVHPLKIDSLQLQSGQVLDIQKTYDWEPKDTERSISDEWILPSGDIPVTLFITSEQPVSGDSSERVQQEVNLDNIPVRYKVDK